MGFGVINEIRDTIPFITLKGTDSFAYFCIPEFTFYGVLFNKNKK